ncbi:hypothetical protein [Histidinibacterium lentulum]|nr:hypothetical protein [Histidinibacterium lentulum]
MRFFGARCGKCGTERELYQRGWLWITAVALVAFGALVVGLG